MTQALTTTTNAPIIISTMMDAKEARAYLNMMRNDLETVDDSLKNFRARAIDFSEREGWRALGYAGVIPAIQAELGEQYSKSYLSRILKAGSIEKALELPIGQLSERTLRPLAELDTPEQQQLAWEQVNQLTNGKPTAKAVEQVVQAMKPDEPDFGDAQRRAVALGYNLSRYGSWWRLGRVGDEYPAGPPIDALLMLDRLEAQAADKAAKKAAEEKLPELPAHLLALIRSGGHHYYGPYMLLGELVYTVAHKDHPNNMRSMTVEQLRECDWLLPGWVCEVCQRRVTDVRKPDGRLICTSCLMQEINRPKPAADPPTIADLQELMPADLEQAGYSWRSADPPTIAHTDGWSGSAPTPQPALLMAATRLHQRQADEPITIFPPLSQAELTLFIREATDFIADGTRRWPTIGKAIRIAARMALEASDSR